MVAGEHGTRVGCVYETVGDRLDDEMVHQDGEQVFLEDGIG